MTPKRVGDMRANESEHQRRLIECLAALLVAEYRRPKDAASADALAGGAALENRAREARLHESIPAKQ